MASSDPVQPQVVEYDRITGVPSEFNEYLPKCAAIARTGSHGGRDSEEYKRWKAFQEAEASGDAAGAEAALTELKLRDKDGNEIEKQLPGGKTKKKAKPEVILDRNTRNKKKCVTTVYGLDGFGIKLSDAAKLFAKKYAGGAAVTKTPTDKEQIDVQGDWLDVMPDFILKSFGASKGITKKDVFFVDNKKKCPFYDDEDD